ncbi:MAG: T9SS type A sorting domain-containing protein, partial [Bacteroidota bacterium]|nr:T9SS type A sorting domain-containing protein [Bacteroidota bacterium]
TTRIVSFPMTSSENLSVIDINSDGLPDVLAGRSEGNLEYWSNTGIAGSPVFQMADENFLGFTASPLRQNPTVAIADLDADGAADLLVGDQAGYPGVIRDFRNSEGEAALEKNLVFNRLLESYRSKNLGGKLWPVVVNLFNTRTPAVVVGNGLGGVHILRSEHDSALPDKPELSIYPNPVIKSEVLNIRADRQGTLEIISVLGQQLSQPIILKGNEVYRYTLPPLAAGLYLVKFTAFKKSTVQRLIIR